MSDSANSATINVTIRENVATVAIENPAQRNALTKAMCLQLAEMMSALESDPEAEIIVLRGAGGAFCAGAAINELSSVLLDVQDDNSTVDHLSNADEAITAVTKPTVALVDGVCMGGGWQIASACDFIIASERSLFAITPAKIGIIYPRRGIERLVRLVGHANAKYLLLTGGTIDASQAQALGLVAEVVSDEDFRERTDHIVASLRQRSRFSMHSMKHLINLTDMNHPQIDQEWEESWAAMSESPDMEIGIQAFTQGLKPRFRWTPDKPDFMNASDMLPMLRAR
jgi:enoyl-CoA hydratase/carnithine racemase